MPFKLTIAIDLDRLNIITIDICMGVRPDSMLVLNAAREVVEQEGFEELLEGVRDRIDEIESLHRTRELTVRCFTLLYKPLADFSSVQGHGQGRSHSARG